MGERVWMWKTKDITWKPRHRREDNTKIDSTEIKWGVCGLDSSVSEYGFCEHGKGHSGNKECGVFDNLRDYFLLTVSCVPWSSGIIYNFSVNISTQFSSLTLIMHPNLFLISSLRGTVFQRFLQLFIISQLIFPTNSSVSH